MPGRRHVVRLHSAWMRDVTHGSVPTNRREALVASVVVSELEAPLSPSVSVQGSQLVVRRVLSTLPNFQMAFSNPASHQPFSLAPVQTSPGE